MVIFTSSTAAAQPLDEPYYEDPRCCAVPSRVQDIDDAEAPPSPQPRIKDRRVRRSSRTRLALDARVGYVYFPSEEGYSGVLYSASVSLTWRTKLWRVGLVMRGMVAPELSGTGEPFSWSDSSEPYEATTQMWGVHLGIFGTHNGFWGSASLGAFHLGEAEQLELSSEAVFTMEGNTIPELSFAVGYDLNMGDHVAWRLSGEIGTFFLLTWRLAITGGLVVKF